MCDRIKARKFELVASADLQVWISTDCSCATVHLENRNMASKTLAFLGLCLVQVAVGQYAPGCDRKPDVVEIREYEVAAKDQHNYYRGRHQAPPLELEKELNIQAQKCADYYAAKGTIDSSCPYKNNTGENQYATFYNADTSRPSCLALANSATTYWYNGIQYYDFRHNSYNPKAGGFTQLVWKGTKFLGAGCAYNKGFAVFTALYTPPGNMLSYGSDPYVFFRQNVFPGNKKAYVPKTQMAQSSVYYFSSV